MPPSPPTHARPVRAAPTETGREPTHEERSERTRALLLRAERCTGPERDALLDDVVLMNLRVARAIAARYRDRGVALDDLEQVATEGLIKAVRRFDGAGRRDLLSYAVPTMRGEVLRYFRDHAWTLRPPRRVQDLQWAINRAIAEMSHTLGRLPTVEELCEHLAIDRASHDEAVAAFGCLQPPSLEQPVAGSGDAGAPLSLGDLVLDGDRTSEPVDIAETASDRALLAGAVARLGERDRTVLYLRFYEDRTQAEIGETFGVAQVQVSRWLTRILAELRAGAGIRGLAA